ncbi:MAG: NfeD family protein [Acidimicrobiales bacterium]
MWVVAGILLGLVVLGAVAGFHAGPHAHLIGSVAGVVAALWLLVMALLGDSRPLLYVLLGADVTISAIMGFAGWKVLHSPEGIAEHDRPPPSVEGHLGVAVAALSPEGIVRVGGEDWTAVSLNGPVPVGGRVQVISKNGVRLEVWGEDNPVIAPSALRDEGAQS